MRQSRWACGSAWPSSRSPRSRPWTFEEVSVLTGLVYGPYHYTATLGPWLGSVPVLTPLAWFMLVYPSYVVANLIVHGWPVGTPAAFVVGGTIRQVGGTIGGPGEDVHIERLITGSPEMFIVPVADGTQLMRLKLRDDTPNVQMKTQFGFFVAFAKQGPAQGEPVLQTCDKLIRFVDEALTLFAALR
jgi:Carotenoid biosynthesis protein